LLAGLSCLQMLLLSATHQNDVRRMLSALWETRFEPLWLIRLGQSGTPTAWIHAAELLASIALLVALFLILTLFREAGGLARRLDQPTQ
jgi:hypothetical protein